MVVHYLVSDDSIAMADGKDLDLRLRIRAESIGADQISEASDLMDQLAQSTSQLDDELQQSRKAADQAATEIEALGKELRKSGVEAADSGANLDQLNRQFEQGGSSAESAAEKLGAAGERIGEVSESAQEGIDPLKTFIALLTATAGAVGIKEVVDYADAFTRLSNQLRVASKDEADYQASIAATAAIAKDTNSDLASTAQLYGKVKQNADDLHISQQQVADVTTLVAKGMQLSGASAEAASGATLQFTQALASGVLRGDEFNSVMEASPALIKAIADGLGVGVGEMRALAEAGQLTSSRVVQALLSQKQAIDDTYGKLGQTSEQAFTQLNNAATLFIGRLNEQTGATRGLSEGLKFLANNMDAVAALAGASVAAAMANF